MIGSLISIGFGIIALLIPSTAIQIFGAEHTGRYVGLHYAMYSIGGILAPPFAGNIFLTLIPLNNDEMPGVHDLRFSSIGFKSPYTSHTYMIII